MKSLAPSPLSVFSILCCIALLTAALLLYTSSEGAGGQGGGDGGPLSEEEGRERRRLEHQTRREEDENSDEAVNHGGRRNGELSGEEGIGGDSNHERRMRKNIMKRNQRAAAAGRSSGGATQYRNKELDQRGAEDDAGDDHQHRRGHEHEHQGKVAEGSHHQNDHPVHDHSQELAPPHRPFFFDNHNAQFLQFEPNRPFWSCPAYLDQFHSQFPNHGNCPSMEQIVTECDKENSFLVPPSKEMETPPERIRDDIKSPPFDPSAQAPTEVVDGFFFPFYLHVPRYLKDLHLSHEQELQGEKEKEHCVLVVPNNAHPSSNQLHRTLGDFVSYRMLAIELGCILIVPDFPRYAEESVTPYTHILDANTLLWRKEGHVRLDLQLLQMIDRARQDVKSKYKLNTMKKIILMGFSASAGFSTRMAVLHPDRVLAVVAGGAYLFVPPPPPTHNGDNRNAATGGGVSADDYKKHFHYPVGAADLDRFTVGHTPFKEEEFKKVSFHFFVGAIDPDDIFAELDEQFTAEDKKVIRSHFGERHSLRTRFETVSAAFKSFGHRRAQFLVHPKTGHVFSAQMKAAAVHFLHTLLVEVDAHTREDTSDPISFTCPSKACV